MRGTMEGGGMGLYGSLMGGGGGDKKVPTWTWL